MDAKGWIHIPLIASFNRVKQLTRDVNLVKDVLSLSRLVEVNGDHVRMARGEWQQFVLPDAPKSTVEGDKVAAMHGGMENGSPGDVSCQL